MRRSFAVLLLSLILCASVFPQNTGSVQCDPNSPGHIPAWIAPDSSFVVEQLNCGQTVTIVGLERGFVKIQIGERIAFVEAKYVKSTESQEPKIVQPVYQAKEYEQPAPTPAPELPAPTPEKTTQPSALAKLRRHQVGLGFEVSHIAYNEPSLSMKEEGIMWGVSGDYTYRPKGLMFKVDGRFSLGNVDYSATGSGTLDGVRDYNFETRFTFGPDFRSSEKIALTPFIGLGYRYLFDGSGGKVTTSGARGYDRKANYLYSPIGLESAFRLGGGWWLGLTGEYDLFWHGWQYSEIGNNVVVPGLLVLPDFVVKNDQESGWGARGSIKFMNSLGRVNLLVEPYLRYWDIEDSDTFQLVSPYYEFAYTLKEPANSSREWGGRVGIIF